MLSDSPEAAERVSADLKASTRSGVLHDYVSEVQDKSDVIRSSNPKLAKIREIRAILRADPGRAVLGTAQECRTVPAGGQLTRAPARAASAHVDCGAARAKRRMDRSVLVYPKPSDATWHGDAIATFTTSCAASAVATLAGRSIPLSADIIASISRDGPLATICALSAWCCSWRPYFASTARRCSSSFAPARRALAHGRDLGAQGQGELLQFYRVSDHLRHRRGLFRERSWRAIARPVK